MRMLDECVVGAIFLMTCCFGAPPDLRSDRQDIPFEF